MNKTATLVGIFALATLIGGVMGYLLAGSIISLWAGIVSGIALLTATLGILNGHAWGYHLGKTFSLALGVFFGIKFAATGNWFPPGAMMILSALVLAVLFFSPKATIGDEKFHQ